MSGVIDFPALCQTFSSSLADKDDIHLEKLMEGYAQLILVCNALGSVCNFVAIDLRAKMNRMKKLFEDDPQEHYKTMHSMIKYEEKARLIKRSNFVSGCTTLLIIRRGIAFMCAYLKNMENLEMTESTTSACWSAYQTTLANYHCWPVKVAAKIAIYSMPKKCDLMRKMCGNDSESNIPVILELVIVLEEICNRIQSFYCECGLFE